MRRLPLLLILLADVSAPSGDAAQPSLAGRIVFSSNRGPNVNNSEIFSIRPDGSRFRDLSRNQGHDGSPVWSPDGRRVAFWSERVDRGNLVRALYVMRADGTGQRRLTSAGLSVSGVGEAPSWSPDGSRIVFGADSSAGGGIWVARADGTDLTFVGRGIEPAWSPQSNRIAFAATESPGGDIALVNPDGSGLRMLTEGDDIDRLPAWAPDGRSLAFVRFDREPPASELYRIGVDGTELRRLAPITVDLVTRTPSWAPNGSLIAFAHASAIWVVSPRATGLRRLALGGIPTFSPDGRTVAYVRGSALLVSKLDGTARRVVKHTEGDFFTSGPLWSRDGRTLLFATMRERADHELYVVNADGTRLRRLTRNTVDERLPAWSPARRRIAFVRGGQIFVMTDAGTGRRRVARGNYPTWSRTGAEIAFSQLGTVFVVPVRGGLARPLAIGSKPVWSPRNDQIAFVRGLDLVVVGRRSGAERRITDLDCDGNEHTQTIVGIPEWSPDGRRVLVPLLCIDGRNEVPSALVIDADGGNRGFLPLEGLAFTRLAWSPDGSRIAFSNYSGRPRIATARLDGTAPTNVTVSAGDDREVDW